LTNYWGYDPHSFFAPDTSYCYSPKDTSPIREFRDMVKALHKAGIEVILDVVFNHTSEGQHQGPTINFKGIDNSIYYHLVPFDKQYYMDYSGCGNTVNCNHPMVDKLIVECLEYWVREMHVDGFRFDEGSIMSRGLDGAPMVNPAVLWHIETSGALADTKIIAEAWDAGGLYQIGYFPGYRYAEWNGRYRDDIRKFVKGDPGMAGAIATRLGGSADLYEENGRAPINSINFITCHDGFTLKDLVSYDHKHNEANGEDNRDGIEENLSWNCGVEGETDNPEIQTLRNRQIKNFAAIWYDWNLIEKNAEIFRFFKSMIAFRKRYGGLCRRGFFNGETNKRGLTDISWHGCQLDEPGWDNSDSRILSYTLAGFEGAADVHVMLNMHWESLKFEIPTLSDRNWFKVVDTAQKSPLDILEPCQEVLIQDNHYLVGDRSVVVLISQ